MSSITEQLSTECLAGPLFRRLAVLRFMQTSPNCMRGIQVTVPYMYKCIMDTVTTRALQPPPFLAPLLEPWAFSPASPAAAASPMLVSGILLLVRHHRLWSIAVPTLAAACRASRCDGAGAAACGQQGCGPDAAGTCGFMPNLQSQHLSYILASLCVWWP